MNTISLPKVSNYGRYSSDNYGHHTRMVQLSSITLYYSYDTIVAYRDNKDGLVVSQNRWGVTTGKHLNWIDGGRKNDRKPYAEFETMLAEACKRHGL